MAKILIADDDLSMRMELGEMLVSAGHDLVGEAEHGQQAIEMAEEFNPDLIFMDIVMPGDIDGITAAEKIKKQSDTAIVFISGYGDPDYIERAKKLEQFSYVMKPFEEKEVKAFIEIALYKREMELKLKDARGRLEKSENRYRLLFEMSNEGVCLHEVIYDPAGNAIDYRILDVNTAYEDMTGLKRKDLIGRKASGYHRTGKVPFLETYTKVAESGEALTFEAQWPPMEKFFQVSAFSPEKGKFATVFRDLTDRKMMEKALRQSEAKFSTVFQASPAYITFTTFPEGRFVETNDSFTHISGYERDKVLGKTTLEIGMWPEPEKRDRFINMAKKSGGFRNEEVKFQKKNGEFLFVLWSAKRVELDGEEYLVNVAIDITDRKKEEQALRESESQLKDRNRFIQTILDNLPIGLAINYFDEGTAAYMNKRFEVIYGWSEEELKNVPEFFEKVYPDPAYRQEIQTQVLADINSGDPERMQLNNLKATQKDGGRRIISAKNIPIFEQNFMISTVQDITDRVKAEKELEEAILWQNEVIKAGNVGLWDWDIPANKVTYSREWKRQIGYEEHEISDDFEEWRSRVHPEDLAPTLKVINQSIAEVNKDHSVEFRFQHKDGSYRWIVSQASILTDDEDRPIRMLGSHFDITDRKRAEKARLESEKRFKDLIKMLPEAVFETDSHLNFTFVNQKTLEITGYTEQDFEKGLNCLELLVPEDRKKAEENASKRIQGKHVGIIEYRCLRKDGTEYPLLLNSSPIWKEGHVVGFRAIAMDIIDRKLKERESLMLKTALDQAPVGISLADEDINIYYCNPEGLGMRGGDIRDLVEIPKDAFKNWQVYMLNGEAYEIDNLPLVRAINNGEIIREEFIVKHQGGTDHVCAAVACPVYENKKVIGGIVIFLEITERKQAEEELRKNEERLHNLLESIQAGVIVHDVRKSRVVEFNPAALKILGITEEQLLGRSTAEPGWGFVHENGTPMQLDEYPVNIVRRTKQPLIDYIVGITKSSGNEPTWAMIKATPQFDREGNLYEIIVASMDISELKRAQSQLKEKTEQLMHAQKMEAIGNLAGGIAHEFNNILGIIMGNAELALDDVPDWNPARESLKEIRKASFRAKEVVRQILSFARKTMTSLKPLEINTTIKESLKMMRASIPAMVDIKPNIPSSPKMILGDPTEIHQIVINLCTNAAHAMKDSGGILEVGVSEVTLNEKTASRYEDLSPGDFVKLIVRDTGEGISPDILEKVFEPYFTTKEFGAGSGMGLSVVYGLVKKCKGAIDIESAVGEGTTVTVLFPKIDEEAPSKEKKKGELPKGNERILLVDDDPSIVNMIRQMLERLGYKVSISTDSTAALESFKSTPDDFDVVITDMAMPNMSGDQLAAELMKVRKNVPILLCTGHSDAVDEKRAKEIGIKGFAMKPLDTRKLARAIRTALDDR